MSTAAKTSARKTTKKETVAVATPAPVAVAAPVAAPAPAPVAEAPVVAPVEEVNIVAEFNSLVTKVGSLREVFASVLSDMKKLEKRIPRELKKASKKRKGKAVDSDKPKRESIFKKPVQISDDLCTFLGKPKGTLMSRSDVTSAVCTYAKTKGLMNKQVINADAALRKLLKITEKDELMILNLQRFLKQHYIKAATA